MHLSTHFSRYYLEASVSFPSNANTYLSGMIREESRLRRVLPLAAGTQVARLISVLRATFERLKLATVRSLLVGFSVGSAIIPA